MAVYHSPLIPQNHTHSSHGLLRSAPGRRDMRLMQRRNLVPQQWEALETLYIRKRIDTIRLLNYPHHEWEMCSGRTQPDSSHFPHRKLTLPPTDRTSRYNDRDQRHVRRRHRRICSPDADSVSSPPASFFPHDRFETRRRKSRIMDEIHAEFSCFRAVALDDDEPGR
jgi:hypothetical protein